MVKVNRRLGRNIFWSIMLFAIVSCTLVSGSAFSEEVSLTQGQKDFAQAETLRKAQKYDEAKSLYQSVSQDSDASLAIKGLAGIGQCDIQLGNTEAAEQLIQTLKTNYSQHADLCARVYDLSYEYWYKGDYSKSLSHCQYITQTFPDSNLAIKAQRGIARCLVRQGNMAAANQAIETLKDNYSRHEDLYAELNALSYEYLWKGDHETSIELWQYVSQNTSDASLAIKARAEIVRCEIKLGNETVADQAIAALKTDYSQSSELFANILALARDYLRLDKTAKSKALFQYVNQNSPDIKLSLKGRVGLLDCEVKSGNYSVAEQGLKQLSGISDQDGFDYEEGTMGLRRQLALHDVEVGDFAKVEVFIKDFMKTLSDRDLLVDSNIPYRMVTDPNMTSRREFYANRPIATVNPLGGIHPFRYIFPVFEAIYKKGNKEFSEGRPDEAKVCYAKAIKVGRLIDSNLPAPKKYLSAEVCLMIAECYRHDGQYRKAVGYLRKAIHKWPDNKFVPQAEFLLEDCYRRLGVTH